MAAPGTQESGHRFDIKVHRDTMPLSLFRNGPPIVGICRGPLTGYILTRRSYGEQSPNINEGVSRHADPVVDNARALARLQILADSQPSNARERIRDSPRKNRTCAHSWKAPTVVNT